MSHPLRNSRRANADIDHHVSYIARRASPLTAAQWHAGLISRMQELAEAPEIWPLADEATDIGLELREILYRRHRFVYRVIYTIEQGVVVIQRVRSAFQNRLSADDI